MRSRKQ
jgi:hypothetical protein